MISQLTIAVPTYNRNDYLVQLLDSIPNDFEGKVLISDNGSFITKEISDKYNKYKIYKISPSVNAFPNWNNCVKNVETEWVILPSDDDLFSSNCFDIISETITNNLLGDIFIFGYNVIDYKGDMLGGWMPESKCFEPPNGFKVFKKGVNARFSSVVFRTDFIKKMGLFDEMFKYTAGDSLLIQKSLLYGRSVFISSIISSYRTWPQNDTNRLIGTNNWLPEVQLWVDKIEILLKNDFKDNMPIANLTNFKDEIYARNLCAGLSNRKKKYGMMDSIKFIIQNRYPIHADIKTQLRILGTILLG